MPLDHAQVFPQEEPRQEARRYDLQVPQDLVSCGVHIRHGVELRRNGGGSNLWSLFRRVKMLKGPRQEACCCLSQSLLIPYLLEFE